MEIIKTVITTLDILLILLFYNVSRYHITESVILQCHQLLPKEAGHNKDDHFPFPDESSLHFCHLHKSWHPHAVPCHFQVTADSVR